MDKLRLDHHKWEGLYTLGISGVLSYAAVNGEEGPCGRSYIASRSIRNAWRTRRIGEPNVTTLRRG